MLNPAVKEYIEGYIQLEEIELYALKAVAKGDADEFQQRLAIEVIVNKFSRTHDLTYVEGSFDGTAFLGGRSFVGQLILKCINVPIGKLKEELQNARTSGN